MSRLKESLQNSQVTGTHKADQAAAVVGRINITTQAENFLVIPTSRIRVKRQVRREFDPASLQELAENIRAEGLHEPIVVRPDPDEEGYYILIAGERRLRAVRDILQEDTITANVKREVQDQAKATLIQFSENIQREDLKAMEIAEGLADMKTEMEQKNIRVTNAVLAEALNKSESWIAKHLRLLEAPQDVQEAVRTGDLPPTTFFNNPDMFRNGMPEEVREVPKAPTPGGEGKGAEATKPLPHKKKETDEKRVKFVSIPEKTAFALLHVIEAESKRLKLEPVEVVGKLDGRQARALLTLHAPKVLSKLKR